MNPSMHLRKWISLVFIGMLIFVFASSVAARTETRNLAAPYAQSELLERFIIISSAGDETCGITADGKVACWGSISLTQKGEELSNVVVLTSGIYFHCALTISGGVKCWGLNSSGELGDGTTEYRHGAVDVKGLTSGVVAIDAGFDHVCAVLRGGGVKCWGYNSYGQLGDGTQEDRYTPVNVKGVSDAVGVAAGWGHTCILTGGGSVRCWGDNTYRQLGNGTYEDSMAPVDVIGLDSGVSAIAAQGNHTCVLMEDGGVKCWGDNNDGQLGDGTTNKRDAPVNVIGLSSGVTALALGDTHTCALTSAGGMKCWGDNRSGQLGDSTNEDRLSPVDVTGLTSGVTAISVGRDFSCAVTDAGPMCWGDNSYGSLGLGIETNQLIPIDPVGLSQGVEIIAAGHDGTCAVRSGGRLLCWGTNSSQQLADGTDVDRDLPTEMRGLPQRVQTLAVGQTHICALTVAGAVWCWGGNYTGQLGNESIAQFGGPVVVSGLESGVKAIAAGYDHACAVTENGGIKCWGDNSEGQLGDGTHEDRRIPAEVSGLTNGVVAVAAADWNTCALTSGGAVKCWGRNPWGQLGNGSSKPSNQPVDVSGLTTGVAAITVGNSHACALMADGAVKCWGYGPLGDGTLEDSPVPVDVAGLPGRATAIAAGSAHTCALIEGGSIQCWGNNGYGGVGNGLSSSQKTPVSVSGLSGGVIAITAGDYHTCALTAGGGMKCWGQNSFGQLGNGDGPDQNTPQPVAAGDAVTVRLYTEAGGFRPGGPLVPEITTYIPTPLDLSPKPAVIGTNLLLAALMMLPFAVAAEFFTRTLAENEETLRRRFRPINWVVRLQKWMAGFFGQRLGKTRLGDILKIAGVMLFYGLVFSLLDKTWKPFSLKGLMLFLSMTIAYGMVGVADDIVQWRRIRRWGLHADLKIRPTNMLLAAISMASTRILSLVPGLMFGTPEALETDEKQFDEPRRNTLLKISGLTFTIIGLAVWLPTVATSLLLKLRLPEIASNLLGGVEAFLLVIFAVALENLFVQMLGFPGSFGQSLKRRSRWLWIGLLVLVTFMFYHTLINPRGDLASALEEGNVILFLSVAAAFVLFTFGMRLYFRVRDRRSAASETISALPGTSVPTLPPQPASATPHPLPLTMEPPAPSQAAPPLTKVTVIPVTEAEKIPVIPALGTVTPVTETEKGPVITAPGTVIPFTEAEKGPFIAALGTVTPVTKLEKDSIIVALGGERQCPICSNTIKADAKLCRFCRATFSVTVRGYCLTDHDIVEVTGAYKCTRCGREPTDFHVESRLLQASSIIPAPLAPEKAVSVQEPPAKAAYSDTKQCPSCGQTIKAEAKICRFCRARLDVHAPIPAAIEHTPLAGTNRASDYPATHERSDGNEELAEEYFDQACKYWNRSKYEKALDLCDKVIELAPDWSKGHNLRGAILEDTDQLEEAISEYRTAVRLDPADKDARENLSLAFNESAKGYGAREEDETERLSEDPLEATIVARRVALAVKSTPVQEAAGAGREATAGFCPHCGKHLLSSDNFCVHCGTPRRERIVEPAPPAGSAISKETRAAPVQAREAGISSESIRNASDGELARMLYLLDKRSNQEYDTDKSAFATTCELIKEIGRKLDDRGGEELMKKVLVRAGALGCNTRFVEGEWDGIGSWLG